MFESDKERETYFKVSKDLYNKVILDDNEFNSIEEDYDWSKEHNSKDKKMKILILNYNVVQLY